MTLQTKLLSTLACIISLLAGAEMQMDYTSPFRNPCSGSATMGHNGDITYVAIPDNNRDKRGATANPDRLWPGARIPYQLDSRYTDDQRRSILAGMRRWEEDTCVRFIERPPGDDSSYVYIFRGSGCCSFVGRQSQTLQQGLSLGRSCMKESTILHELGHAIGFWHEQSRPDRDEYINILTQNIARGQVSNFDQYSEEVINSLGVPYDYNSIMHYNNDTFGGGRTTILANDPIIPVGRAVDLSNLDVLQANLLYQCDIENFPPIETQVPPEPYVALPPLPECGEEFVNQYSGSFSSPGYPTYTHNQNCAWRITVPDGMLVTVTITQLSLDWSPKCVNDGLVIYRTPDASAEPALHPRCGLGTNMVVPTDSNAAYVAYYTDEDNVYRGYEGFYATFTAEDIDECAEYNGGCSQHCRNFVAGYECYCDSGWFLSADLKICFDDNECAVRNGGCQDKCVNNGGSYTCECSDGAELNSDGRTCTNTDATCEVNNGGCDHICSESHSGVSCHCREGYRLHPNGASCLDIDECFEGLDTCSYGGCRNTPGAYSCTCHSGYEKDPDTDLCINVNECERGLHGCDGLCRDTDGSYECSCPHGLKLDADQHSCIDINECQDETICSHFCVNEYGFFQCTCPEGYLLDTDGSSCIDIDECLEGVCAGANCQNTEGSYECHCDSGFRLSSDGQTCEDINECDGQNNCERGCSNTEGSFVCTCPEGFELTPDGHSCKCGGRLNEASGSFSSPGWPVSYPQENFECEWFIELPDTEATIEFTIDGSKYGINGRDPCPTDYIQFIDGMNTDANSMYRLCKFDNPGPFTTTSSQARVVFASSVNNNRPTSRVGVRVMYNTVQQSSAITNPNRANFIVETQTPVVVLVDECAVDNGGCEHTCVDTPESYYCECPPHYILDDDERSCRCGGVFTAGTEGSFQTPGWPNEYPQDDFTCEWTVIAPSEASRIEFIVDPNPFGISGRPPCTNDFLQFFNGLDQSSPLGDKYCFLQPPPAIYTPSNKATIIFQGTVNRNRPLSRKGVKVNYQIL